MERLVHTGLLLLFANLIHGGVALVWVVGLKRFAGPISANLWTDLLSLSLVLPAILGIWHLVGLPGPPGDWALMRVDRWGEAVLGWGTPVQAVVLLLLFGTVLLFVLQEALPAWRWRTGRQTDERHPDERLDRALDRVLAKFAERGPGLRRRSRLRARRLDVERLVAALDGLIRPTVLVSRGLLDKLDDEELEAVLAHELAHLTRGGNTRALLVWAVRALQAASPAALVIARNLFEAREAACDAIAAKVTGRPAALAEALLKVTSAKRPAADPSAGPLLRARAEVLWRSDFTATKIRVRALLDHAPSGMATRAAFWSAASVLALFLWTIQ